MSSSRALSPLWTFAIVSVALFMVVLQGMSYEDVAAATGCAVGTAKSRVFRARRQLEAWLMGEEHQKPAEAPRAARQASIGGSSAGVSGAGVGELRQST